jgi:ribonuclease HII
MPDLSLERELLRRGARPVAGADEAGRGPLAGPVVAAAVILPPDLTGDEDWLRLLDDSKRLTRAQRERAFEAVEEHALDWGVASVDPKEIDRIGIGVAALMAMMQAVEFLHIKPAHLLLDYIHVKQCPYPYDTVVKGDSRSYSIAAASNVAKVTRDRMMGEYDAAFPSYGFAKHKGYATRLHLERLREIGPCEIHRRSFAPVAQARLRFPEQSAP